jgi:Chaperone of endosialidase
MNSFRSKTTISLARNSIKHSPLRRSVIFIPLAFVCFALAPMAWADCQEGCHLNRRNTFLGDNALIGNTTGRFNTATGAGALSNNTTGFGNTATGEDVLSSNTLGSVNTATGVSALRSNTTGTQNTATGADALENNRTGPNNTADGFKALQSNTEGMENTASGMQALYSNTRGFQNTAIGVHALSFNVQGHNNTAIGFEALLNNTGSLNIAVGNGAGSNLTRSINNIDIGNDGVRGENETIRIGNSTHVRTFIAGISGSTIAGTTVEVNAEGQLGVSPSSARFKDSIKPMGKASEGLYDLKPVAFRYKKEIDAASTSQFGLVAEDVEKVNSALVVRDKEGKPYSVRYNQVNAMLLNEFLKEHRKVEKLEATVAQQHQDFEAAVAELKGQIQKVSAQLELNKSAPQTVLNDQ